MNITSRTQNPTFGTAPSTAHTLGTDSFMDKVPLAMLFMPNDPNRRADPAAHNDAPAALADRRVHLPVVTPDTATAARRTSAALDRTSPNVAAVSLEILGEFGATDDAGDPRPCSVWLDKTGTVASVTGGVASPRETLTHLDTLEGSNRFEMAVSR